MKRFRSIWLVCCCLVLCVAAQAARAESSPAEAELPSEELFARAATAQGKGQIAEALVDLETLADRGFAHPDASFNRGLCYVARARSKSAEPGDLGRAAAAFEEVLLHRPADAEAADGLDRVRRELARRRMRRDKSDTLVRPSIDRALMSTLHPNTWSLLAILASVALGLGLLLWRMSGRLRVAGTVLLPLSLVLLIGLVPLALTSRWLAKERRLGVVVADEINLQLEPGAPSAPAIPEGSLVEIGEDPEGNLLVRWGSHEGHAPRAAVRPLAQ